MGPKIQGVCVAAGTSITLTMSLDLHGYPRSTLGGGVPNPGLPRPPSLLDFSMKFMVQYRSFVSNDSLRKLADIDEIKGNSYD